METTELIELPKEFRELWLEALRSGRYKQGTGSLSAHTLHDGLTWCCLGVACHVLDIPEGQVRWLEFPTDVSHDTLNHLGIEIPEAIRTGVWSSNLADMNDNGKSFDEIADHIESTSIGV
jgi:hypothetical protein